MKELRSLIVEIDRNGKSHITAKCPFCESKCPCGALLERFGCIKETENDI